MDNEFNTIVEEVRKVIDQEDFTRKETWELVLDLMTSLDPWIIGEKQITVGDALSYVEIGCEIAIKACEVYGSSATISKDLLQ